MVPNTLEIYENWDEKIDQCYWKTLVCHLTTLSAKKTLHDKHLKSSEQYLLFRSAHIFEVGKFFNFFAIQDIKVGRGKIPRPTFMSVRARKLAAPYFNVF